MAIQKKTGDDMRDGFYYIESSNENLYGLLFHVIFSFFHILLSRFVACIDGWIDGWARWMYARWMSARRMTEIYRLFLFVLFLGPHLISSPRLPACLPIHLVVKKGKRKMIFSGGDLLGGRVTGDMSTYLGICL